MAQKISKGLQEIRARKGLSSNLSRHLGITRQAVSGWKQIPIDLLITIEQFTGIPREKLRPELFRKAKKRAG